MSEDYSRRDYAEDMEDSVQATSVSAATNEKKVGGVTTTPSAGDKPNDQHKEKGKDGSDRFGIPVQFKN